MSDLRWQMVSCVGCGRHYRCTPDTDYYHPPGTPEAQRLTDNGRCWDCLVAADGLPPQAEPTMGEGPVGERT